MIVATVAFTLLLVPTLVGGQQWAPLLMDNSAILNVSGRSDVNPYGWGDSYSVGTSCYCKTNFDHNIDVIVTPTPFGNMTIKQICTLLGPGPGWTGRPRYNDIQCGNGPPNDAGDEHTCPGRIEYGKEGCKYIGPKWNFTGISIAPVKPPTSAPVKASVPTPIAPPTIPQVENLPWLETFNSLPPGSTMDVAPTSWTAVRSSGTFSVDGQRLRLNLAGPEGVFTTTAINCSQAFGGTVRISVDVVSAGSLEAADYAKLIAIADGGTEVLLGQVNGNTPLVTLSGTITAVNKVVVKLRAAVSYSDENYYFDNLNVTAVQTPPSPIATIAPPSPAPATKSPTIQSPATKSPTIQSPVTKSPTVQCEVPLLLQNVTIGASGINYARVIETSCATSLNISLNLSHQGTLESSGSALDFLKVYYQVLNQPEVLWLDIVGDLYSSPQQVSVVAGSSITIRIVGDTTSTSEAYILQNFRIVQGS